MADDSIGEIAYVKAQKAITQLATKTEKTYVDALVATINASPKGVYATAAALAAAFPTGNSNIYVVTADGKWYYWNGSAWTAGAVYQSTSIADGSVTSAKTTFAADYLQNLWDPAAATDGYRLTSSGAPFADALYTLSDYIPVVNGKTYSFYTGTSNVRVCGYNTSKVFNKVINSAAVNGTDFVIDFDGYIRVPVLLTDKLVTQVVDKSIYNGTFSAYGVKTTKIVDLGLTDTQKQSTLSAMQGAISVKKSGEIFEIRSNLDTTSDIVIQTNRSGSNNGSFNIVKTMLYNKGELSGGSLIDSNSDDITPIRLGTWTTLGANHGYTSIAVVTVVGHDKTVADLGSQWTDGVKTYTLLKISGNDLTFGAPYTVTDGVTISSTPTLAANLTHVSGATHTSTVSKTTQPGIGNGLLPSTNNKSVKYFLDGVEITTDGVYYGFELRVHESYNIMDYKSLIDYAQTHIGTSYANDNVGGAIRLSISYVFTDKGSLMIHHNFRVLSKVTIGECGFIQAIPMSLTGYKVWKYIPNVLPTNGIDFKTPVDMSAYNTTVLFGITDCIDSNIPVNRVVDWLKDSSTGARKLGFTMGYIPDKSDSKYTARIANSSGQLWEVRNTKKTYPCAMRSLTLNTGDYKNFICYRNFISPEWDANATGFHIVKDKKDVYVFIDYHTNASFANIKLDGHEGKTITVFEKSADFTVHNDIVDADGVIFSVVNNYGYAILKVS